MPKLGEAETFRIKYSFPYLCRPRCIASLYYLRILLQYLYLYSIDTRGALRLSRSDRLDDRRMTAEVTIFSGSTRVILYIILLLYVKNIIIIIITDTAAGNNSDGGACLPYTIIYHATHGGSSEREPFFFGVCSIMIITQEPIIYCILQVLYIITQ